RRDPPRRLLDPGRAHDRRGRAGARHRRRLGRLVLQRGRGGRPHGPRGRGSGPPAISSALGAAAVAVAPHRTAAGGVTMTSHCKILFSGPVGAGKSTAIRTLSDTRPVVTEARATDETRERKRLTTVAM